MAIAALDSVAAAFSNLKNGKVLVKRGASVLQTRCTDYQELEDEAA